MRSKVYIIVVLALMLFATPIATTARNHTEKSREYQIKAAFLYNFIKFVDWPEEKLDDITDTITIGIIGKDPFGNAFEPIKNKKVQERKVAVKRFKPFEALKKSGTDDKTEQKQQIDALRKCHLLFISSSEKDKLAEIIEALKGSSVLTIGETADFLETGGMINLLMEAKKVRFEINIPAAQQEKIKIRSKLLRLAKRVVEKKPEKENENKEEGST
jgi:hypothetical protein